MTNEQAKWELEHIYGMVAPDVQRALDKAIEALGERVNAEWIVELDADDGLMTCSECGTIYDEEERFRFCPWCGAEMKGGGEE